MTQTKILRLATWAMLALTPLMSSCDKEEDIDARDEQIIQDYIAANDLVAEKTTSGVYYIVETAGNTVKPTINSEVRVSYKGYYTDGEVFDENTLTFPLRGVIKGWQDGIPNFSKGGKGKLLIPSRLGYGSNPPGNIRKDAVLIFNIHLIDIK